MPQWSTTQHVVDCLHISRFGTYMSAAGQDVPKALQLYRWNLELASAFYTSLSLTEVVLRNAIDRELRVWNATQPNTSGGFHQADWLLDPARPLNSLTSKIRQTAMRHAAAARAARPATHPRKNAPISHDDLLAQLTFGVFVKLLPTADPTDKAHRAREVLWTGALASAFPGTPEDPDGVIAADRASRLHSLRNRVAHMEPLLQVNVRGRHRDMIRLVGSIRPEIQGWFSGTSRVMEVWRAKP
ncbi:hypothetical protein D1871_08505 [Nakamurella silvestris]|nr:hypothetical protein D1871_08505 [Nakamurella silvestris]